MDLLRRVIVEWIETNGRRPHWLLDVYYHLISYGASPDAAITAMELFVDELVEIKTRTMERVQ